MTTTSTSTVTSSKDDSSNSANSTTVKQRLAFNWQFLDADVSVYAPTPNWNKAKVSDWLSKEDLSALIPIFEKEDVDGQTLLDLTEDDLKDLSINLGNRKKFIRARSALTSADSAGKRGGVILPKGLSPNGPAFTANERHQIKHFRYDIETKKNVERDVPLTEEELACWDEQASWLKLVYDIDQKWRDADSCLGVGLYHAPRHMSDKEIQRGIDDELRATQEKLKKKEEMKKKQEESGETPEPSLHTSGNNDIEFTNFEKMFQVYPSVAPPPEENLKLDSKNASDVPLGIVDVIVGPTFDVRAYHQINYNPLLLLIFLIPRRYNWGTKGFPNKGIKPKKDRGVLSMDQQYNAFNFLYYILRARINGIDSFERKLCSNRLSFFIDELHGERIFPLNIESQLSLLVYRDKRLCKDASSLSENDRQALLADAIRKSIPRILRAVVMEVVNGRSSALDERIDHAIRTYLLIHQISIKLVLYYRKAYESLYRSIVLWIQNPFAPICDANWPNLEDVLIGASLVGIPWAIMRESFVRKLLYVAISAAPKLKGTVAQLTSHLFEQNKQLFHLVLYEISFFFTSARSLIETDRTYSRCAGSLPKRERDAIKATVQRVAQVETFQEVWVSLGMGNVHDDEEQLDQIGKYLRHLTSNVPKWRAEKLPESKIVIPSPEAQLHSEEILSQGLVLRSELDRQKEEALAIERANHRGFPPAKKGKLDRLVCAYPKCQKKFKCRDHLFRHLKKVIEPERMIFGMPVHENSTSLKCDACEELFSTKEELYAHDTIYAARGVLGFLNYKPPSVPLASPSDSAPSAAPASPAPSEKGKEKAPQQANPNNNAKGEVDAFADMGSCVICMDKKREAAYIPCGHLICCYDCAQLVKECAMCRVPIRDVIRVYCS